MYYKYLPIERISYLENELIRFTQPGDLNDPFECLPQKPTKQEIQLLVANVAKAQIGTEALIKIGNAKFLEIIEKYIDDIEHGVEGNLLDKIYNSAQSNINESLGILSLSKNWNSTLMWAHYTISHRGFCIGFDSNHSFFKNYLSEDKEKSFTISDVNYSTDRVKIPMKLGMPKIGLEPYITKSIDWEYEQEVRMIGTLNLAEKVVSGNSFSINLFKVPHSAIKEIIVGANIQTEFKQRILDFCEERNIPCYQSKIANVKYDMERTLNTAGNSRLA
jgi:hypothetical protein